MVCELDRIGRSECRSQQTRMVNRLRFKKSGALIVDIT
jgi:hypothetical protein